MNYLTKQYRIFPLKLGALFHVLATLSLSSCAPAARGVVGADVPNEMSVAEWEVAFDCNPITINGSEYECLSQGELVRLLPGSFVVSVNEQVPTHLNIVTTRQGEAFYEDWRYVIYSDRTATDGTYQIENSLVCSSAAESYRCRRFFQASMGETAVVYTEFPEHPIRVEIRRIDQQ